TAEPSSTVSPTAMTTTTPTITPTTTSGSTIPPTATTDPSPPETVNEMAGAELPAGFSLIKFATVYRRTSLAFDEQGRLFATSADGTVHLLTDSDQDGRADKDTVFAKGFLLPLGITFQSQTGDAYVSSTGRITRVRDNDGDDIADEYVRLVSDLPTGLHQNNTPHFGPDGWLYMGVGSTCDACTETDERSATIMRFDPATGAAEVVASGLRNPYDVAFHPVTGALFATSNGRDDLGDDIPQEELNHIVMGHDYGWPDCWDNLEGPDCDGTTAAVAFFRAHSSANSLAFYTGGPFPAGYQNELFVTIWGTWLISGVQAGIQRVSLTPAGESYTAVTDWFLKVPQGVMPLGMAVGPDGALYFGDYIGEAIYRISYGSPSPES
ncbi:MAG: PQQ-dependent sugar dehydrogenase, partial [Anaerolineales bacterium]|nr:PQQ-dependent sugar dehydrogenase [Anaerolineales bacterium]